MVLVSISLQMDPAKVLGVGLHKKCLNGSPLGTFEESEESDWVVSLKRTTYFYFYKEKENV